MVVLTDYPALIVIDMQKGLLQKDVYGKQALIGHVNDLMAHFHDRKLPVILFRHSNDSFLMEGSPDWEISDELCIAEGDLVMNKTHGSIFKEKLFRDMLKEWNITSIVIMGLLSNGCIRAACQDANKLVFPAILVSDGHSTYHKKGKGMVDYWNACLQEEGTQLRSSAEVMGTW